MTGDAYNIRIKHAVLLIIDARHVLVPSSSSSRAPSKRVLNQTMLNVLDPLVVLVLLPVMPDLCSARFMQCQIYAAL